MTTFGEINEPSSRTAWEDWDDDNNCLENYSEIRFEKVVERPRDIDTFIILEGKYLFYYIRCHQDLELVNTIAEVSLRLYKIKNTNNYVCMLRDYNLVLSSEIVELLKEYIDISTDVIAILTKPLVDYQVSELVSKNYLIRSLSTSRKSTKCLDTTFPNLEQPNIISGVSAGVLCWREVTDKPAAVLVCYVEHREEQHVQELYDVLQKFKVIPHSKKPHQNLLLDSNLYI